MGPNIWYCNHFSLYETILGQWRRFPKYWFFPDFQCRAEQHPFERPLSSPITSFTWNMFVSQFSKVQWVAETQIEKLTRGINCTLLDLCATWYSNTENMRWDWAPLYIWYSITWFWEPGLSPTISDSAPSLVVLSPGSQNQVIEYHILGRTKIFIVVLWGSEPGSQPKARPEVWIDSMTQVIFKVNFISKMTHCSWVSLESWLVWTGSSHDLSYQI